jgi:hypothetical protein
LLYQFISTYMYEWDTPKAEQQLQSLAMQRELVEDLLEGSDSGRLPLKPEAIENIVAHAGHTTGQRQARTTEELAVLLLELGDLSEPEITARASGDAKAWLAELAGRGNIVEQTIATVHGPAPRWISRELTAGTRVCRRGGGAPRPHSATVLRRFCAGRTCYTASHLQPLCLRPGWLDATLSQLRGQIIVQGHFTAGRRNRIL